MRSVSKSKARKPAPAKSRKPRVTAEALERLIAERAGVPRSSVAVRGTAQRWEAMPIPRNGQRATKITLAAYELQDAYELEG